MNLCRHQPLCSVWTERAEWPPVLTGLLVLVLFVYRTWRRTGSQSPEERHASFAFPLICNYLLSLLQAADHLLNELSDSEPEDLAQMKIDDWLVFQLEREVQSGGSAV